MSALQQDEKVTISNRLGAAIGAGLGEAIAVFVIFAIVRLLEADLARTLIIVMVTKAAFDAWREPIRGSVRK